MAEVREVLMQQMVWRPWQAETSVEDMAEEEKTLKRHALTRDHPATSGDQTRLSKQLKAFQQEAGPTPGCRACDFGPHGRQHSYRCRTRKAAWARKRTEISADMPGLSEPHMDIEVSRKRPASAEEDAQPAATRRLRAKTTVAEPPEDAMQTAVFDGPQEPSIELVQPIGPPWYDELTGEELEEQQVMDGMQAERNSLGSFHTFDEVDVSEGDKPGAVVIPSRWVLTKKSPVRVKGRVVVQQVNTGSLMDTFAASPTSMAQRIIVQRALERGWSLVPGDVATAFLHAPLPEDMCILVKPPATEKSGCLWRLRKALYGLRVAPRLWQEWFAKTAKSHGFRRLLADAQLYEHEATGALMMVFADDILLAVKDTDTERVKADLDAEMKIRWGEVVGEQQWTRYLGREWRRVQDGYEVRIPECYWTATLARAGLQHCKPVMTPGESGTVHEDPDAPQLDKQQHSLYRTLVGRLMWTLAERPDLAFVSKELARKVQAPTTQDWQRLKRLLRYAQRTKSWTLFLGQGFCGGDNEVSVLTDASWASSAGRKSTSGGTIFFGGVLLQTWSRTQSVVALSSCEAEFLAVGTAVQEGALVQHVLAELGVTAKLRVYCDSSSARQLANKRGVGRLKHMQIRELFVQEEVRAGRLELAAISSVDNLADLLTKAFTRTRHDELCRLIGLQLGEPEVPA